MYHSRHCECSDVVIQTAQPNGYVSGLPRPQGTAEMGWQRWNTNAAIQKKESAS